MNLAFDLDGTLITAGEKQSLLLKAVARRYNITLSCESVWTQKRAGKSNRDLLTDLGIDRVIANTISVDWQREVETSYWLSLDTLFEDSYRILQQLKANGIRLILITARQNEYLMRHQIWCLGIAHFFESIYCVLPKEAVTAKHLKLRSAKAAGFIGDSETDLFASQLADVPFYAVSTGQRSGDFLQGKGASYVGESLTSSVDCFLRSVAGSTSQ